MKKTILLSSIFAVGAALADGQASKTVDSTEVAVMCVTMPTQASLIAVPFAGYTNSAITVADMISTAELAEESKLYVPNASGTYDVWNLGAEKKWEKTKANVSIGADGTIGQGNSPDANDVLSARGSAFWLEPASGSTGFAYLLGQSDATEGKSSVEAGKWNLIGNTSGAEVTLSQTGFLSGDRVAVPNGNYLQIYSWDANKGWWLTRSQINQLIKVPAGTGIWFFAAKGSPKGRTIKW